ncbi:uncharacterized protein LOC129917197 isoform X2 [Episyrphus balteatus]|uniref:uncharacterized protein LOC129917197 isoform X2 n=1 Tax=Episyrphus balteatus TaxID=286459 RepID=UPI002485EF04|nr:uncharacterized protein LOC129917197 isoform X2 [Episyrphus balteatus]
MFANNFYILLGIVCCLQQLNVNAYPTINIRRLFDSAIEGRYKKSDINFPQSDEDVLELDHLKHDEQPTTADESNEEGDIHFEIPSVNAAPEYPVGQASATAEDTPINPTDLLPELEQQLEEMTTAKTSIINNAAGQKEGEQTPEGITHHRPPMLPHYDGGKVGSNQQQPSSTQTASGTNEESIGTGEGNVNSPILTKTAENLLKHKDGQYSSFDMAQYVFWTGDEAGVARAVEEFIEQGLMSRENAIKFLRDIRLGIEYLQSSYANRVFPDQLRDNFIKKHSHNPMPTEVPAMTTSTTTTTTTTTAPETTRRPLPLTTERTRSFVSREYPAAAGSGHHQMALNHQQYLEKTIESMPSRMRFQDVNNVHHHERERSEHDEAAGRAKIAKFLYTEFSLEEVIYQLGKVMFSESLSHGSDQAQQELQRLTDFLEEEGKQGMISPELQKKVLDVLLQALSDTLVEHPELLAAARANLGSSFDKLPNNSLESKN